MTRQRALIAIPLLLWLGLGLWFIASAAPTYDEPVHLASGYSYLKTGKYRLNIMDHPPLAEMWAAAAVLPLNPPLLLSHPDWLRRRLYHYSDHFVFHNRVAPGRLVNAARAFSFITLSALLAWALWAWARREGGEEAALAAAAAAALSPVLLSNLALVTTDGLPAVMFFCVFWLLSAEKRTPRRWAAAGAAAGAALAGKFSMISLLVFVPGMLLVDFGLRRRDWKAGRADKPRFNGYGPLAFFAAAFAVLALAYRVVELPLYWEGLAATLKRLGGGRSAFFHGAHATTGFWLYFPAALLLKTPPPVLGLAAGAALFMARKPERRAAWMLLPPLAFFAAAMTSKVQIGVRHLLPIVPFMCLLAGLAAAALWRRGGRARAALAVLLAWTLASVARAAPHQLAYFNAFAGGPRGGLHWLGDSNLDWGQGLKGLGERLAAMGSPPVYLSYFGVADPAAYGIRYVPVFMCCNVDRAGDAVDPARGGRVLFAVSATNRQAVYFRDKELFAWLNERAPAAVIGHAIFLYDLTADAAGRARLAKLVFASTRDAGRAQSLLLQSK